jgi:DNA-binding NarL/FixJ family response regulator
MGFGRRKIRAMRHGDSPAHLRPIPAVTPAASSAALLPYPSAKARGKRLDRQPGQRPKSDRLAGKVLALVADGRSYRPIARELDLIKNTVLEIVKRNRATSTES